MAKLFKSPAFWGLIVALGIVAVVAYKNHKAKEEKPTETATN